MILLPGIRKVAYCKAASLQLDILDIVTEFEDVKAYGTFTDIPIVGLGAMSVVSEDVKGQTLFTVKVQFQICDNDQDAKLICRKLEKNNHAFYLENIEGVKLLLGLNEKPHPVVLSQYSNDGSPDGKRGYFVTVTYQNTHSYHVLE